jgi:hypothetical protein
MWQIVLRSALRLFSGPLLLILAAYPCQAGDADHAAPRFETYIGADYAERSASFSTTTVWSAFGPITEPGLRLKLDGLANVYGDGNASMFSSNFSASDLKSLGDIMAGYQLNRGTLWVKIYGGAAYLEQTKLNRPTTSWGLLHLSQEKGWGAAAAVETFWRASDRVWTSASVSWLQLHNTTSLYSRGGYEIYRSEKGLTFSAGAEASGALSNINFVSERRPDQYKDFIRGGALLNLRYGFHDLTLSGGLSQASDEAAWRPYATLSYGKKF